MRVKVKQNHRVVSEDGGFKEHLTGQEIEITEEEFAENLHEPIKEAELVGPILRQAQDGEGSTLRLTRTGNRTVNY